jgi:hypothetical protein
VVRFAQHWKQRTRQRWSSAAQRELLAGWSAALNASDGVARALSAMQRHPRGAARHQRQAMHTAPTWSVRVQPLVKALLADEAAALRSPFGRLCALELLTPATISLPHKLWWPLWRATLNAVHADREPEDEAATPDVRLLVQGELPFLAGLVFADLKFAPRLAERGRRLLRKELVAQSDSDGTPRAELLPRLPLWLAPLVRCTVWADRFGAELWTADERRLLSDVTERAVALCRGDGRSAMTNGEPMPVLPVLTKAAELFNWSRVNPSLGSLKQLQRQSKSPRGKVLARRSAVQVMPSNQSDWARTALLRTDWSPAADSVALAHHGSLPQMDVTASGRQVLHGTWDLRITLNGTPVELADEWSCAAWESDPDGDYAELQMLGPRGMRVERTVFLSRKDRFLFLADSVGRAPAGRIELVSRLPLAEGVAAQSDKNTRCLKLQGPQMRARVFPLALPTTWVYSTPHRFVAADGHLELHQVAEGRGLFAPLVFDWHPLRHRQDAEWRTLTVSENMRAAAKDAAAGHRLRVGSSQWLFYRSLQKSPHARAVLGMHSFYETVIARFDSAGDIDPLMMIEG